MPEFSPAEELTLRKVKATAPPFHRHIARGKLLGEAWRVGDRVVVYEVIRTVPEEGPVVVTERTRLVFE